MRARLLQLYRVTGAVAEDKKAMVREAMLSGDSVAAMKIIREAEQQVAMIKTREERSNPLPSSGQEPVSMFPADNCTSSLFITQPPTPVHLAFPPQTSARPSTARASSAARMVVRERPATARPHMQENSSDCSPSHDGEQTGRESCQNPPENGVHSNLSQPRQAVTSPRARHTINFALEGGHRPKAAESELGRAPTPTSSPQAEQSGNLPAATPCMPEDAKDDSEAFEESAISLEMEEPGDKKFKVKVKTEKQIQIANWLRLAAEDDEDAAAKISVDPNDRIELPNAR